MSDDKPRRQHFGTLGDPVFYATTEPLRVYRQFLAVGLGVYSPHMLLPWPPCEVWLTAHCPDRNFPGGDAEHDAPVEGCGCGIYGWYQPDRDWFRPNHDSPWPTFGVVEVAGRMILGDYGVRAERARILALEHPRAAHYAEARFDHRWYTDRDALVRDFPPSDWDSILNRGAAA